jgi:ketosteroid isomerase-like protein
VDDAIGTRLVEAIAARDRDSLASCFASDAEFRALLPPGLRERTGAEDAADLVTSWFADATEFELVASQVGTVGDRLHVAYTFRGVEEGEPFVVGQQLYCETRDGKIVNAKLLCSGFRPPAI